MNLRNYIFYLLVFCISWRVSSQELPPIQNFTPRDYIAENQNWAIDQGMDKTIYVANNKGLLTYNGAEWQLYDSPNKSIMRSVKVIDEKIYTGSFREFGFWEKDDFGKLTYHSLSNKLSQEIIEYEYFWNIIGFENWILFQSLHNIYIYNKFEETFSIINSETQLPKVFKVGNSIYFQKMHDGLYKIENGKPILVTDNQVVKENILVDIFLNEREVTCLTQEKGFFILKGSNLIKKNLPSDKALKSISVYSSLNTSGNLIVLGTIAHGIYVLNMQGEIVQEVKQENGINNNTVLSLFEDIDENIWLGLDNGLSVVNVKSPFRVFNDLNGKIGAVYSAVIFNNYLYIGTNQGLYYKKKDSNEKLTFIEGTAGQVWFLKEIDNKLFCGHNNGTYVVNKKNIELISDVMGTWDIQQVAEKPNLLIQGHYNGLNVLEKVNGKWKFRNRINGFKNSCRHFVFNGTHEIIVNHEYEGLYKLRIDADYRNIVEFSVESSVLKGVKSAIREFKNNIFYASDKGVFKFQSNIDEFVKDSTLTENLYDKDTYISGQLIANENEGKLWMFTQNNIVFYEEGKLDNVLRPEKIVLPAHLRGFMSGYENVMNVEEDKYLFGASNGYFILDLNELNNIHKEYNVNIYAVEKGVLDELPVGVTLKDGQSFKSNENNISFKYFVPEFEKYNEVNYRHKLVGFYENWSDWSSKSSVFFKNLPFGKYEFHVQAKIGSEFIEDTEVYKFEIKRPWFIATPMLIFYTVLFFVIVSIVHMMYKRNFNKQKQKLIDDNKREFELNQLENEKVIMQLQNEKLKQDVDGKTKELSASAMSIIKKNELLTQIKSELMSIEDKKSVQPVIKIINKNLVNNDDWELFQDAFNNADTDFLKRIKSIHPQLTPNDLKLCAYLRLNLASKEIAPLLNISTRSVEIKRYRLRKKMSLPHEKSLVEYIIEL